MNKNNNERTGYCRGDGDIAVEQCHSSRNPLAIKWPLTVRSLAAWAVPYANEGYAQYTRTHARVIGVSIGRGRIEWSGVYTSENTARSFR